jgi:hypothetical protein
VKLLSRRDHRELRASKAEHWARLTPARRLALADDLRRHMLSLHPDWPTAEMRDSDLKAHVRLLQRITHASKALRRR